MFLRPIVDAYYYGPDRDYTEHDFERYLQNNLPRADGIPYTETDFLEEVYRINHIWQDIDHYIDVIKRLCSAINLMHSLGQDPMSGDGPSILKEVLDVLELAVSEGATQIRISFG